MLLFPSLACAAGATEHLPWMSEVQGGAGRAPVMGTGWTAPARAPVRSTVAPHKHKHCSCDITRQALILETQRCKGPTHQDADSGVEGKGLEDRLTGLCLLMQKL